MSHVIFFEKPGCSGNARQRELLLKAGHTLDVRDLLSWPWSGDSLMEFLGELPVGDWFNRTSPRVKSGEVKPDVLSPRDALALLLADPSLIRRPLMQVGRRREVGFLAAVVDGWIGLEPLEPSSCGGLEGCGDGGGGASCGVRDEGGGPKVISIGGGSRSQAT
jgi:nitrogenase-associated protein